MTSLNSLHALSPSRTSDSHTSASRIRKPHLFLCVMHDERGYTRAERILWNDRLAVITFAPGSLPCWVHSHLCRRRSHCE
ncbi:hypothetical protein C8Q78DRAFT_405959 [Trametes maxima]|nr:hypothetical protein C8Q78DRAFT_405959 [Trametes maxima]